MKKLSLIIASLFISTAAFAADLPTKAATTPASTPADLFSGWWIGAGVGYGWGKASPDLPINDYKPNGVVAGGSLGYRTRIFPNVYLGIDGTMNYAGDMNDNQVFGSVATSVKQSWYGTAGLSLGYLVMPDLLVSATGGVAYGAHKANISSGGFSLNAKDNSVGWYVGASAEYALAKAGWNNWTIGVDYKHISYSDVNFGFPIALGITVGTKADIKDDVIMATARYRFNL